MDPTRVFVFYRAHDLLAYCKFDRSSYLEGFPGVCPVSVPVPNEHETQNLQVECHYGIRSQKTIPCLSFGL